jgi:hypothetical protein
MIPRTVQMAAEVAAQFTALQLEDYGNIILNGYATTGPNTTGKLAWQYQETTTAPVPLPSVTSVQPALKGWTTNYYEYYTQLPPNAYNQVPGNPTMFEYTVHSFTQATGTIASLGVLQAGSGYTPGTYTNVPTVGGSGTGATLNITVDANGDVTAATLSAPGADYTAGDGLTAAPGTIGPGSQFAIAVATINVVTPGSEPKWAQPPRRTFQNQVSAITPPQYVNNPQAIQYSFMYPVADNPVPPPIDVL